MLVQFHNFNIDLKPFMLNNGGSVNVDLLHIHHIQLYFCMLRDGAYLYVKCSFIIHINQSEPLKLVIR